MPVLNFDVNYLFEVQSPKSQIEEELRNGCSSLCEKLETPLVEFKLKILYPKKFQALRRFYCGTHNDFIKSIMKVEAWAATGGKTQARFFKSHDEKYVFKEVNKAEYEMLA